MRLTPFLLRSVIQLLCLPMVMASPAQSAETRPHVVVPGFERFHGSGKDPVAGGRLLLSELNCTSCHRPGPGHDQTVTSKKAPILDGVGTRVKPAYLKRFLLDPQSVKPGSAMPDVLSSHGDREALAEALAQFLASTGPVREERPDRKHAVSGRQLYHRIGCVACHGSRKPDGSQDKLLPTSVPLGELISKFSIPGLARFLANPHEIRPAGRMPGLATNKEALDIAHYLLQGAAGEPLAANLNYVYYEGSWDRLPDFARLTPVAAGQANGFDLSLARRPNNFALKFTGYLRIDQPGNYRFFTTSDDGSRLIVAGKQVLLNDGVHPPSTATGTLNLVRGMHPLVLTYFQGPGEAELNVEFEGPGLGRRPLTNSVFLTPRGDRERPSSGRPKTGGHFSIDRSLAARGRELFATLGCANCHSLTNIASRMMPPDLARLNPTTGCLAEAPGKDVPRFALNTVQRTALAMALRSGSPSKVKPRETIVRALKTFNCYACHERDNMGGVEEGLSSFFVTAQPEMGEEGRLPPTLNGVGGKLTLAYLKKIMAEGSRDRPYMYTHMPKFGEANTGPLIEAFTALDHVPPAPKAVFKAKTAQVKAAGRHLVGAFALGCIKCHTFAGHKAEGVQGIDMTLMTRRLNYDWFYRYLLDPQKIRPGTRMPAAWPMGQSMLPRVLGGNTTRQIDAIFTYLSEGARAALPVGLGPNFIPLTPDQNAIIYRNFIQGAGTRAIGVGYPEHLSLAFDANNMCLAMIWQGAFIDASRHWVDRGAGFQPPLGDNVVHLAAGPNFAILAKPGDPWTAKNDGTTGLKFEGYRLTPDSRPTFLYRLGAIEIADFPNPATIDGQQGIRRKLMLNTTRPEARLWFRAAVGQKIEAAEKNWFVVDGNLRIRLESDAAPVVRQAGGRQELLIPVRFGPNNKAALVQDFLW
jgi:cbb3-type cytochrome oxidase cytochrome c subunit